jgi:hypothetical protein
MYWFRDLEWESFAFDTKAVGVLQQYVADDETIP